MLTTLKQKGLTSIIRIAKWVPPHHFWLTLAQFVFYSFKQAAYTVHNEQRDEYLDSQLNFQRAHLLEKTMYCKVNRTARTDSDYVQLKAYVRSFSGQNNGQHVAACGDYLERLVREYEAYPQSFECPLHHLPFRRMRPEEAGVVRKALRERRSIRMFQPQAVDEALLQQVIEAGLYAPSSCNTQQISFITVSDADTLDLLFRSAVGGDDWRNGVPAAILTIADRRSYMPFHQLLIMAQDVAVAMQNMQIMAHALGLGSCWVTIVSDMHILNQEEIYRRLQLPSYFFIGGMLAIGHPHSSVCPVPRRPIHQVWFQERFDIAQAQMREMPAKEVQEPLKEREVGA
jgi:nitroreductase